MVMAFFTSKISIVSIVLTSYGFLLSCLYFVHLALLDYSTPHYLQQSLTSNKTEHSMPSLAYSDQRHGQCIEESHTKQCCCLLLKQRFALWHSSPLTLITESYLLFNYSIQLLIFLASQLQYLFLFKVKLLVLCRVNSSYLPATLDLN